MNAERLFAEFDRLSEAPDAIGQLRRFILQLAVQGRVVAQRPSHEGMSPVPAVPVVGPYSLPPNWTWIRLAEILDHHLGGGTPSKSNPRYWDGDVPWASVKDVGKAKYLDNTIDHITDEGLSNSSSNLISPGHLIVVTRMGLGKVSINRVEVAINQDLRALGFNDKVTADYAYIFFLTHGLEGSGLTVKGIKLQKLLDTPFPLAPPREQHRIVDKVDELMALCDELDDAQAAREKQRDRLTTGSLARLTEGADNQSDFRERVNFHFNHFGRVTARSDQIGPLRQTILALAVRGRLVEQSVADKSATVLLADVARTKQQMGMKRTGRDWVRDSPLSEPFPLPSGWAWTRIGNAVERVTVGFVGPMTDHYVPGGVPFLRSQNVRPGRLREEGLISITPEFHQSILKSALEPGDVVVVRSGNVGTACAIPSWLTEANCSDLVVVKRPLAVHPEYLCFYLNSLAAEHVAAGSVGMALTHFNTKSVAMMPLPVPPAAEQNRIVARVGELMAMCDELERGLTAVRRARVLLLDAVVHEALAERGVEREKVLAGVR